jgi:transposase-like protein
MKVHWKIAPHIRADSAPITAIVCKSCGHVELIILNYANIDPHQQQCPHCRAIYYYVRDATDGTQSVTCQNCGKDFQIEDSRNIENVFDEIEEDLLEE